LIALNQTCANRGPHCGPRGIVHDLEMVFQMNCIPQVFVLLISQSFATSFSTWSEVYSPRISQTICNCYATALEVYKQFVICYASAICNCYATAQVKLCVMSKFLFVIHMRGSQRLCCMNLFEQIVRTRQAVVRANW